MKKNIFESIALKALNSKQAKIELKPYMNRYCGIKQRINMSKQSHRVGNLKICFEQRG
jgi:hypothetical protein